MHIFSYAKKFTLNMCVWNWCSDMSFYTYYNIIVWNSFWNVVVWSSLDHFKMSRVWCINRGWRTWAHCRQQATWKVCANFYIDGLIANCTQTNLAVTKLCFHNLYCLLLFIFLRLLSCMINYSQIFWYDWIYMVQTLTIITEILNTLNV